MVCLQGTVKKGEERSGEKEKEKRREECFYRVPPGARVNMPDGCLQRHVVNVCAERGTV